MSEMESTVFQDIVFVLGTLVYAGSLAYFIYPFMTEKREPGRSKKKKVFIVFVTYSLIYMTGMIFSIWNWLCLLLVLVILVAVSGFLDMDRKVCSLLVVLFYFLRSISGLITAGQYFLFTEHFVWKETDIEVICQYAAVGYSVDYLLSFCILTAMIFVSVQGDEVFQLFKHYPIFLGIIPLTCVKEFVLTSENYNDIMQVKGMPGNIFGDKFWYEMQKEIANYMKSYYDGETGKEDVENYFYECCTSMRVYLAQTRQTTGTNEKDNTQILSQIYEMFAKENQRMANHTNYQEGLKVNCEYGGNEQVVDWCYYNSDYYYQCEETHQFLKDITQKMTEQWSIPTIDTEDIEKKSKLTLDGNFDFNSGWNHHFRRPHSRGSIEDESLAPPKDFKMYYKENNNNSGLGMLVISAGENKKEIDVPFQIIPGSLRGQIYNVSDLIKFPKNETTYWEEYNTFCKNFDIFTRSYAYASGINMQAGKYIPAYE